ncbi:hypothetical protein [Streptomyces mesophilus]|uniref:hypothetical protein n=1 Tax=Streptomyces mesophilus TaxID=1775132 RepID=UPI0033179255
MARGRKQVDTIVVVVVLVLTVVASVAIITWQRGQEREPLREGCRYVGKFVKCDDPGPTPDESAGFELPPHPTEPDPYGPDSGGE